MAKTTVFYFTYIDETGVVRPRRAGTLEAIENTGLEGINLLTSTALEVDESELDISFAFSAGERSSIFRLLMIYGQIWGTPWCGKNSRLIPALTRGPRHITLSWRRPLSLIPKDKKARN